MSDEAAVSTEAQTLTLTDFLRARYDDDEANAHGAAAHHLGDDESHWTSEAWGEGIGRVLVGTQPVAEVPNRGDFGGLGWYAAAHIAAHDPARVLADLDAKRRIIAEHAILRNPYDHLDYCRMCVGSAGFGETRKDALLGQLFPCLTLRLLALPYADHPHYREEWRP